MRNLEKTGEKQYEEFVNERLVTQSRPVSDPIKRNHSPLFSHPPVRYKSQTKQMLSSVKSDCSLYSRLYMYISCQTREGDLDEFFAHENQACPSSLLNKGKFRLGIKSDIVSCLEELVATSKDDGIADTHPGPSTGCTCC